MNTENPRLGVDFFGVVVPNRVDVATAIVRGDYANVAFLNNAAQHIRLLNEQCFKSRCHVVILCLDHMLRRRITEFLHHSKFFNYSLTPAAFLHFVDSQEDRAAVCKEFGITHFVGYDLPTLHAMETVERRVLLGSRHTVPDPTDGVSLAHDWSVAATLLKN